MPLLFATCSFQEFRPEMGTPVRSSRGYPRFTLKYPLIHAMPSTFPEARWLRGVSWDDFDKLYRSKIYRIGLETLTREAERIRESEAQLLGDERVRELPVVLLCFERWNQKKQPDFCHRHNLAAAIRELSDGAEPVPELGASPRRELASEDPEQTLF